MEIDRMLEDIVLLYFKNIPVPDAIKLAKGMYKDAEKISKMEKTS